MLIFPLYTIAVKSRLLAIAFALNLCLLTVNQAAAYNITQGHININTATFEELQLLKHVGPKTAHKIIVSRNTHGAFQRVDELVSRKLIAQSRLDQIQTMIVLVGPHDYETQQSAAVFAAASYDAAVTLLPDEAFFLVLMNTLKTASESVWLTTFVFKTTDSTHNRAGKVINLLGTLVEQGVDVTLVLEYNPRNLSLMESNQTSKRRLINRGARVIWDNPSKTMHSKIVVIDNRWVFIGSHNMTHSALALNNELSLMIDSPQLAASTIEYIQAIMLDKK